MRLLEDRQERRDFTSFRFLRATPADMGNGSTPVVLPGRARLAISHSVALAAGALNVNVGSRLNFSQPALAANQVWRGVWGERGMSVTVDDVTAPAGTLTLYIVDPFGRHVVIATATLV